MKVKILKRVVLNGVAVEPGAVVEVEAHLAELLLSRGTGAAVKVPEKAPSKAKVEQAVIRSKDD